MGACYVRCMVHGVTLDAPPPELAYGRPMSIEEWEQMEEDAPGELVDGRLEEEEVADSPHEVIVSALLYVLLTWAREGNRRVLSSETKYALSDRRGRKPISRCSSRAIASCRAAARCGTSPIP